MKSCRAIQENLKAYLDHELPYVRRIATWQHLLHCAECREALKAMTEISRRLNAGETDALEPALRARILSSVTYTDSPREVRAAGRHRRPWHPLLVGGATAAGLLVVLVMSPVFFQARERARSTSERTAATSSVHVSAPSSNVQPAANGRAAARQSKRPMTGDAFDNNGQVSPPVPLAPGKPVQLMDGTEAKVDLDHGRQAPAAVSAPMSARQQQSGAAQDELIISDKAGRSGQYYNAMPAGHRPSVTKSKTETQLQLGGSSLRNGFDSVKSAARLESEKARTTIDARTKRKARTMTGAKRPPK